MKNQEIKSSLIGLLNQLKDKGIYGDTGDTANEVRRIIEKAIPLIQHYNITTDEDERLKNRTITNLAIANKIADNYYEKEYGFDTKTFRNNKIVPHMYVNRAYNALDYFIYSE